MCGISGIFQFDQRSARPDISLMTNAIRHRGPDAEGVYKDDHVSLGHRRLSIIDLSEAANQPFEDISGRYVIVFNGEIYNYKEVKQELRSHQFRTNSDTEVILASFKEWGVDGVQKLKGMFVFVIWDRQEKKMFLFRDRMGVKPLYYFLNSGFFLFSSEIRGILASDLVQRKLDRTALIDYFSFQSFSFPDSPVSEIRQLEAGCWMEISDKGIKKGKYWALGQDAPGDINADKDSVHSRIRELFSKAVERRLVSDVPVGAFLSGGIDSSAVVAMMAEHTTPVTFNITFEEEGFDESGYAALIARKYNTKHHVISLTNQDFLDEIELGLDAMDCPSADGINTYVVSKAIRNAGLKVALSGIGGDELFAGYPFFKTAKRIQDSRGWLDLLKPIRKVGGHMATMSSSPKIQRIASMLKEESLDVASLYPHLRRIITPEYLSGFSHLNSDIDTGVEKTLDAVRANILKLPILSQVSVCEYLGYTQNTLLKDADQMSMAVALEVREPFFDHDLISYVLNVPDNLKYPVYPKSLLVESLGAALPPEIVHRRKQGFLFPWPVWMRNELRSFCATRIENISKRDFIKGEVVIDWWNRFLKGDKHIRWTEMWMLVVLEHWLSRNRIA